MIIIFAFSSHVYSQTKKSRIAVIGAGIGGLSAAHYLKKSGFSDITVYEKDSDVGGKINSFIYEGKPYEMGAVWLGGEYKIIQELAEEFSLSYRKVTEPGILKNKKIYSYNEYALTQYNFFRLASSLSSYKSLKKRYPELEQEGFQDYSSLLQENVLKFSREEGIWALCDLTASFMTGCGYGYFESIPAMYLMKLIPMAINGLLKERFGRAPFLVASFEAGWQQLLREMAKELDVRLDSSVDSVKRIKQDDGTYKVLLTSSGVTAEYDQIVIASPLQATKSFIDLDEEERNLFDKIDTYRYIVTLIKGKNIPHVSLMDHVSENTIGHVNLLAQYQESEDVYTVYQIVPKSMSLAAAKKIMIEDIEACGGSYEEEITQRVWDYFPHVASVGLKNGFYEKLESRQGEKATFYVGGIMNFETVESTARYSKHLVEKYFKP